MSLVSSIKSCVVLFLYFCLSFSLVQAEETKELDAFNYDDIASTLFWKELYRGGGWTLYCGYRFTHEKKTEKGKAVGIGHIYPTTLMFKHLGCSNRMQCQANSELFSKMEADLHNLYPVWQAMITYRYDHHYGLIDGEEWRFDDCDFEWKAQTTEPREKARGNIARAMLYMHTRYGVSVEYEKLLMFKRWNRDDPPSKGEVSRNDRIEKIQGQRNPYVDNPSLADQVRVVRK